MTKFFKKGPKDKPPYLDRIEESPRLSIVRLKGRIDQAMVPVIDARIKANRKAGSKIDKNVLLDFAKVEHVDSATIVFHLIRLKEYEEKGFKIGFINVTDELKTMLEIYKENDAFKIYSSEAEAVREMGEL